MCSVIHNARKQLTEKEQKMIKLNHSINLVTEIDEMKMPAELLGVFLSLDEVQMEALLRQTFISALTTTGFLNDINENNSWATVKVGNK
jgi:hypothetical protein